MQQRVFVTGGSGFVGASVIAELTGRGFIVKALVNQKPLATADPAVTSVRGDLFDSSAWQRHLVGCSVVIHLVGIIRENPKKGSTFQRVHVEGTRSVVDAAIHTGVRRYVQMSALGSRPQAESQYHKTKFAAEEYVRQSGLDFTIFRPSLIHGPGGEFMQMEAGWARKTAMPFFAMPYFGSGWLGLGGSGKLQPIFVSDVARAMVDSLAISQTIKKTYEIGGTEVIDWPQMHEIAALALVGHRRWTLPFPAPVAKIYAAIGLGRLLGFNRDQVVMSQEDNICDLNPFTHDFGWTPTGFTQSLAGYASQIHT